MTISLEPYAKVAARLLQGPLYDDETNHWQQLTIYQTSIYRSFAGLGLELIYAETDGVAFLRQLSLNDNDDTIGLIPRHPLTYEQSLICVVLRAWLDEFDASDALSRQLYVTRSELLDRIDLFLYDQPNKVKQQQQIERQINNIEKLGFLRLLRTDDERYEVRRIIKYKVTPRDLDLFRQALTASRQADSTETTDSDY